MKFDFHSYDSSYVMHCSRREDAKLFLKHLHELGLEWRSGDSYLSQTHYDRYGAKTCYYFYTGTFGYLDRCREKNCTILEFEDFDWSSPTLIPPILTITIDDIIDSVG